MKLSVVVKNAIFVCMEVLCPLGLCEVSSASRCSLPIGITNYFPKTCELRKDVLL